MVQVIAWQGRKAKVIREAKYGIDPTDDDIKARRAAEIAARDLRALHSRRREPTPEPGTLVKQCRKEYRAAWRNIRRIKAGSGV